MNPFVNPNKRSISLPNGCKDLADIMDDMDDNLFRKRAEAFGAETVDLREVKFTPELLRFISSAFARKHRLLPIYVTDSLLGVALADPSDLDTIDYLARTSQRGIDVRVANSRQLDEFIWRLYGGCES